MLDIICNCIGDDKLNYFKFELVNLVKFLFNYMELNVFFVICILIFKLCIFLFIILFIDLDFSL